MAVLMHCLVWDICLNSFGPKINCGRHSIVSTHCELEHHVMFWLPNYLGGNSVQVAKKICLIIERFIIKSAELKIRTSCDVK